MTSILNITICGKLVPFTTWHTAEMYSAQNFHLETTKEVRFLKNAYRSLSRALCHFFVLTNREIPNLLHVHILFATRRLVILLGFKQFLTISFAISWQLG